MGNMKDLNSAHHCSSSFFWRIVPRYERITARNHGQIVGILSQAGYHQGWSALAQNLIHFWSVDTPPENKHSCRPVEELMGDDDPKHNLFPLETQKMRMVHNLPKFLQRFEEVGFLPKIGPIGLDILFNPLGNRTLPLANPEWWPQYGTEKTGVV